MAKKTTKKQEIKKTDRKKLKSAAKKTPSKSKPKTAQTVKPSSRKPSGKKNILKTRTQPEKKIKPKTTVKPAVKKVSLKSGAKPGTRTKRRSRPLVIRKPPEIIESERRAALRKLLVNKREEIVKEVKAEISKYIKGETRQLVDTALDDGDWSVVDLSEDISFKHMSTHRENLVKIDEALRKLNEGTYGTCEDCGEEISEERLKILPFAIYCLDCQEKREQIEEIEKREGIAG